MTGRGNKASKLATAWDRHFHTLPIALTKADPLRPICLLSSLLARSSLFPYSSSSPFASLLADSLPLLSRSPLFFRALSLLLSLSRSSLLLFFLRLPSPLLSLSLFSSRASSPFSSPWSRSLPSPYPTPLPVSLSPYPFPFSALSLSLSLCSSTY